MQLLNRTLWSVLKRWASKNSPYQHMKSNGSGWFAQISKLLSWRAVIRKPLRQLIIKPFSAVYKCELIIWNVSEDSDRFIVNKSGVFRSVQKMLHWFAGKHVRDVAVSGNLLWLHRKKVAIYRTYFPFILADKSFNWKLLTYSSKTEFCIMIFCSLR